MSAAAQPREAARRVRGDPVEGWHDTVTVPCCTTTRDGRRAPPRTGRRRRRSHTPSRSLYGEPEHGGGARRPPIGPAARTAARRPCAVTAVQAAPGGGAEPPSGDTVGRQSRGSPRRAHAGHACGATARLAAARGRPRSGRNTRAVSCVRTRHSAECRGGLWRLRGLLDGVNWYVGVVFLYIRRHWSAWARAAARSGTLRSGYVRPCVLE